jgi:hypothetical protein
MLSSVVAEPLKASSIPSRETVECPYGVRDAPRCESNVKEHDSFFTHPLLSSHSPSLTCSKKHVSCHKTKPTHITCKEKKWLLHIFTLSLTLVS